MWNDYAIRDLRECRDQPFEEHRGSAGPNDLSGEKARDIERTNSSERVRRRPCNRHGRIRE
jgi:hypothetical protein